MTSRTVLKGQAAGPTHSLVVAGLTKRFGGITAVDDVTFSVRSGTVGIIGPNGSGKSTLLNMMSGNCCADSGSVLWRGRELVGRPPNKVRHVGVVRTFQDSRLLPDSTVLETLRTAADFSRRRGVPAEIFALFGQPGKHSGRLIASVAARFGIEDWLNTPIAECPSGIRSLVALASVEIGQPVGQPEAPRLWLLDEPFSGVDVERAALLGRHLRGFASDTNVVIIVDHRISYLRTICDYLIVLNQGVLLEEGETEDVLGRDAVVTAYLGTEGLL
jgi:ABC-type branched-subunit amino acid transport system ATPase component